MGIGIAAAAVMMADATLAITALNTMVGTTAANTTLAITGVNTTVAITAVDITITAGTTPGIITRIMVGTMEDTTMADITAVDTIGNSPPLNGRSPRPSRAADMSSVSVNSIRSISRFEVRVI
jgi:hypothetical protein